MSSKPQTRAKKGRGRGRKTFIVQALRAAAIEAEAIKIASERVQQKLHEKKSLLDSAREHLGKMIDRIDPLEATAILGATYLIKQGIQWTEVLTTSNLPNITWLLNLFNPFRGVVNVPVIPRETAEDIQKALDTPQSEAIEWLLAFAAAFIIVRHAGEIIQAGSNILNVGKSLLLGFAAVA